MSTRTPGGDVPIRRLDRILAFMSLGLAVVSIVCFFAIIIARPAGVTDFTAGHLARRSRCSRSSRFPSRSS